MAGDFGLQFLHVGFAVGWSIPALPYEAVYVVSAACAARSACDPSMVSATTRRPTVRRPAVQVAAVALGMLVPPLLLMVAPPGQIEQTGLAVVSAGLAGLLIVRYRLSLRLLSSAEQRAARAESSVRRRVAQDLHDGAIQDLLVVRMMIAQIEHPLAVDASEALDQTLGSVRSAVQALRDSILGADALGEALRTDLEYLEGLGVDCELELALSGSLSAQAASLTYRNVREALRNVARHAGASSVRVSLVVESGWLTASVVDDGRGFDHEVARRHADSGHIGLLSIRETVEDAAGVFSVGARQDGSGCELAFSIPALLSAKQKASASA